MRLTRVTALCLALAPVALHAQKAEHVNLNMVWDMNPKAGIYTNKNTGVSFTQYIAGFRGHDAYPLSKDGIARFQYLGETGYIV